VGRHQLPQDKESLRVALFMQEGGPWGKVLRQGRRQYTTTGWGEDSCLVSLDGEKEVAVRADLLYKIEARARGPRRKFEKTTQGGADEEPHRCRNEGGCKIERDKKKRKKKKKKKKKKNPRKQKEILRH